MRVLKTLLHIVRYLETLIVVLSDLITLLTNYRNLYLTTEAPLSANFRHYLNNSLIIRPVIEFLAKIFGSLPQRL